MEARFNASVLENEGTDSPLLSPVGMIAREWDPMNLEMPFGSLEGFLTRIIASAQPFNGYYQTIEYAFWNRGLSAPTLVAITEMQLKAQIARPGLADAVRAGQTYWVRVAAWTSEVDIAKVEISDNGGETWHIVVLLGEAVRHAWRLWEFAWSVPLNPGKATLMARATDSNGRTQPTERDRDCRSYMINHLLPVEVDVL